MRWKYGEQRGSCRVRIHKTTLYGVNNVFDEEPQTEILLLEQKGKDDVLLFKQFESWHRLKGRCNCGLCLAFYAH
jgi:hypothetical protein